MTSSFEVAFTDHDADYDDPLRPLYESADKVDEWLHDFMRQHKLSDYKRSLRLAARYLFGHKIVHEKDLPEYEKKILFEEIHRSREHEDPAAGDGGSNSDSSNAIDDSRQDVEVVGKQETWRMQSRSLKTVVLVIGILSATCQGWYQSVVAGSLQYMVEDEALGFDVLFRNFTHNFPGFKFDVGCLKSQYPETINGRSDSEIRATMISDMYRLGGLAAAPSLAAAMTFLLADPLQHHFLGRRGAVAWSAFLTTISTIALMFTRHYSQVLILRIIIGLCLGAKASIIAPWLGELAPTGYRGRILATWEIGDSIGIFFGFLCWFLVERNLGDWASPEAKWKLLSALPLITTIPLIVVAYVVPESYIFLLKTRKYKKAMESAQSYAICNTKGLANFIYSHLQMIIETSTEGRQKIGCPRPYRNRTSATSAASRSGSVPANRPRPQVPDFEHRTTAFQHLARAIGQAFQNLANAIGEAFSDFWSFWNGGPNTCPHGYHRTSVDFYKRLWKVVWSDRRCRNALISCGTVMVAQASCGINAFALLSSLQIPRAEVNGSCRIQNAEASWNSPEVWAASFGGVICGCSFIGLFLTDKYGRTTLTLCGLPIMTVIMATLTGFVSTGNDKHHVVGSWILMLMYTAIYTFTLGTAAFSLPAESFPSSVREAGMALCVALNMLSLGLQVLLYPIVSAGFSYGNSLVIYLVINIVSFVLLFLFCIDTKNRSLDDLQYIFSQPLSWHVRYRFHVLRNFPRGVEAYDVWVPRIRAEQDARTADDRPQGDARGVELDDRRIE